MDGEQASLNSGMDTSGGDLEAVVWSENPERRYLQAIVGKKQLQADDMSFLTATPPEVLNNLSIAGFDDEISTLADTYNEGVAYPQLPRTQSKLRHRDFQECASAEYEDNTEDEVSTLANDTYQEQIPLTPSKISSREIGKYLTARDGIIKTDDDMTAPETPPEVIRVKERNNGNEHGKDMGKSKSNGSVGSHATDSSSNRPFRKVYVLALFLGFILLASILSLSIGLIRLRKQGVTNTAFGLDDGPALTLAPTTPLTTLAPTPSPSISVSTVLPSPTMDGKVVTNQPSITFTTSQPSYMRGGIPPTDPLTTMTGNPSSVPSHHPTNIPSSSPSASPSGTPTSKYTHGDTLSAPPFAGPIPSVYPSVMPTTSPSLRHINTNSPITPPPSISPTPLETQHPSRHPTREPSTSPSGTLSSNSPTMGSIEIPTELRETITRNSPNSIDALGTRGSPQLLALEWLSLDPNVESYDESRLLQRWSLSVFFLSLSGDSWSTSRSGGWMTYTDECSWFSVASNVCNRNGMITKIDLRSIGLKGTIPSELSLLSNSLAHIFLQSNEIYGTIPSEIGLLHGLDRLQLTFNGLTGTIPTEIGRLSNIGVLGLGRNEIRGKLPTEFGNLVVLDTMGLEKNKLSGQIPTEFGRMEKLRFAAMEHNELAGGVPRQLRNLDDLQVLRLQGNQLIGEFPDEVCELVWTGGLVEIDVDCDEVVCSCCATCHAFYSPPVPAPAPIPTTKPVTAAPLPAPTPPPVPPPTKSPTRKPTIAPTKDTTPESCVDSITTKQSCYTQGDNINISFRNCNPESDDWVGLYLSGANNRNLGHSLHWIWACGDQGCNTVSTENDVMFTSNTGNSVWNNVWPLLTGSYKVVLARRNAGGPYSAYASSSIFEVKDSC